MNTQESWSDERWAEVDGKGEAEVLLSAKTQRWRRIAKISEMLGEVTKR